MSSVHAFNQLRYLYTWHKRHHYCIKVCTVRLHKIRETLIFFPVLPTRPHYLKVNGVHFLFTCSMNQVQFYLYLPGPQFIKNDNQIWNFDEYKEAIYWSLPPEQYNTPILMISSIPVWIEKNCLSIDIKFTGMNLCVLCFSIINKVIDQAKCLTVTGAEIHITCTWLYNDGFGTFSIIHV